MKPLKMFVCFPAWAAPSTQPESSNESSGLRWEKNAAATYWANWTYRSAIFGIDSANRAVRDIVLQSRLFAIFKVWRNRVATSASRAFFGLEPINAPPSPGSV